MNKIVYHGSPYKFESFDYTKIGQNGTASGYGIYFTDDLNIARGYATRNEKGYIYKVEINCQKTLSDNKITMKRTDFIRLVKKIGIRLIENYGNVENVVKYEYDSAESDTEFISGIIHAYGNAKEILRLLYTMFGYTCAVDERIPENYNGYKKHTVYTAFVPESYKIISMNEIS